MQLNQPHIQRIAPPSSSLISSINLKTPHPDFQQRGILLSFSNAHHAFMNEYEDFTRDGVQKIFAKYNSSVVQLAPLQRKSRIFEFYNCIKNGQFNPAKPFSNISNEFTKNNKSNDKMSIDQIGDYKLNDDLKSQDVDMFLWFSASKWLDRMTQSSFFSRNLVTINHILSQHFKAKDVSAMIEYEINSGNIVKEIDRDKLKNNILSILCCKTILYQDVGTTDNNYYIIGSVLKPKDVIKSRKNNTNLMKFDFMQRAVHIYEKLLIMNSIKPQETFICHIREPNGIWMKYRVYTDNEKEMEMTLYYTDNNKLKATIALSNVGRVATTGGHQRSHNLSLISTKNASIDYEWIETLSPSPLNAMIEREKKEMRSCHRFIFDLGDTALPATIRGKLALSYRTVKIIKIKDIHYTKYLSEL